MDASQLNWLSAADAARAIRDGAISSEQLAEACLARVREAEPQVQAWQFLDPEHVLAQARARDADRREGRPLRPAARRAGRHQGHHRHRRHADRGRHRPARRPHAGAGRDGGGVAARGRRGDHGQDGDHRVRVLLARQDAQSAQPGAHAGRLVLGLGRGGRRGHGAARARQPDQRLDHPAGGVLRRLRLQADPRPDPAARHPQALAHPRPRRRVRAHARGRRACSPRSSSGTTSGIRTRGRARAFRSARSRRKSRRCRRGSRS